MRLTDLRSLFVRELHDLLHAELQQTEALPRFAAAALDMRLRHDLEEHIQETKVHADRLASILANLHEQMRAEPSRVMECLIAEADRALEQPAYVDGAILDAAIIASVQRVEHYEIAVYGCARAYAKILGIDDAATILQESLDQEVSIDRTLTALAEDDVNPKARQHTPAA